MPEMEIYPVKFYKRPTGEGWRLSFFEIHNFGNGADWCLVSLDWAPLKKKLTVF
jgi:hypothetical protein